MQVPRVKNIQALLPNKELNPLQIVKKRRYKIENQFYAALDLHFELNDIFLKIHRFH